MNRTIILNSELFSHIEMEKLELAKHITPHTNGELFSSGAPDIHINSSPSSRMMLLNCCVVCQQKR